VSVCVCARTEKDGSVGVPAVRVEDQVCSGGDLVGAILLLAREIIYLRDFRWFFYY
jgi:hypothetical protein